MYFYSRLHTSCAQNSASTRDTHGSDDDRVPRGRWRDMELQVAREFIWRAIWSNWIRSQRRRRRRKCSGRHEGHLSEGFTSEITSAVGFTVWPNLRLEPLWFTLWQTEEITKHLCVITQIISETGQNICTKLTAHQVDSRRVK